MGGGEDLMEDAGSEEDFSEEEDFDNPCAVEVLDPRMDGGNQVTVKKGERKGAYLYEKMRIQHIMGDGMDKSWGDVTYQVGDDVRIFAEGDLPYSLGRIIAIGKGGTEESIEESGEIFLRVYWYYLPSELDKELRDAQTEIGIPLHADSRMILLSFHSDDLSPIVLRGKAEIYFTIDFPASQNELKDGQFCCSHIYGVVAPPLPCQVHSIADTDFLASKNDIQKAYYLETMNEYVKILRTCRAYPYKTKKCIVPVKIGVNKKSKKKLSLNYFDKMGKESKESPRVAAARSDSDDDDDKPIGAMCRKKERNGAEDAENEKERREEEKRRRKEEDAESEKKRRREEEKKRRREERNVQNRVVVGSGLGNRVQEQEGKGIEKRRETKAFDGGDKCKSKLGKVEQGARSRVERKENQNKSSSRDGKVVDSSLGSGSASRKRLRDSDVMVPRADKKKDLNATYDDSFVLSISCEILRQETEKAFGNAIRFLDKIRHDANS